MVRSIVPPTRVFLPYTYAALHATRALISSVWESLLSRDSCIADCTVRHPDAERQFPCSNLLRQITNYTRVLLATNLIKQRVILVTFGPLRYSCRFFLASRAAFPYILYEYNQRIRNSCLWSRVWYFIGFKIILTIVFGLGVASIYPNCMNL